MIEQLKSKGYYIESFTPKYKEFGKVKISTDSIVLFDAVGNFYGNKFYEKNYKSVKAKFHLLGYNFSTLSCLDFPDNIEDILQYYIPQLHNILEFVENRAFHSIQGLIKDDKKYFSLCAGDNKRLLNYLGYTGEISSGFIVKKHNDYYVIKYAFEEYENGLEDPINFILEEIEKEKSDIIHSRHNFGDYKENFYESLKEQLDDETFKKLKLFEKQLEEIKHSGQLLLILPLLQEQINKLSLDVDLSKVSIIQVTTNNEIELPYFNGMVIPLSHLTKSIYILFTRYPEGIDLNKLATFERELLNIYLDVSPLEDLDKMIKSVKDVINLQSKAIYTHISRIKSAFYKIMADSFASQYVINSFEHGGTLKYISILYPKRLIEENITDIEQSIF